MLSTGRIKGDVFFNSINCPNCHENKSYGICTVTPLDFKMKCENCYENERLFEFRCNICEFQTVFCMECLRSLRIKQSKGIDQSQINSSDSVSKVCFPSCFKILCVVACALLSVYFYFSENPNVTLEKDNVKIINNLRKLYPSQKNETWYHFLSVLDKETPTVKSITFLHGEDKKTSERLTKELVSLYTENNTIKIEDITFSTFVNEDEDYGIVLEHYHQIVKRFRVFITHLNKVSGNTARIFHSLCDEVSSDIKPSLFIFTLMYNKRIEDLKPVERVTAILKATWNDLPENEIFPLLSRIVKNVIDVTPEKEYIL